MQNGKGSKPRNNFSRKFRQNYDAINWKGKTKVSTTKGVGEAARKFLELNGTEFFTGEEKK